jgi:hypothetical protein
MDGQVTGGRNPDPKLIKARAGDKTCERAVVNGRALMPRAAGTILPELRF